MRDNTTLLLADDDDDRRIALEEMLTASGYTVVSCDSVDECLAHLRRSPTTFSALLGKLTLHGASLLPKLEQHWRRSLVESALLYLWSPRGTLDVYPFGAFLQQAEALVFSLPLDVDVLLHVVDADNELGRQRGRLSALYQPIEVDTHDDGGNLN